MEFNYSDSDWKKAIAEAQFQLSIPNARSSDIEIAQQVLAEARRRGKL